MWEIGWATPIGLGVFLGGLGLYLWGVSCFLQHRRLSQLSARLQQEVPPDDPD